MAKLVITSLIPSSNDSIGIQKFFCSPKIRKKKKLDQLRFTREINKMFPFPATFAKN